MHGDTSTRQRHVLAAPAKGIISGSSPATCEWAQARRRLEGSWRAACSATHEPVDGMPVAGLAGAFFLEQRSVGTSTSRQIRGGMGEGGVWLAHEFRRESSGSVESKVVRRASAVGHRRANQGPPSE